MKEVVVSYGADVHDCMLYKQTQNTESCTLSSRVYTAHFDPDSNPDSNPREHSSV